MAQIPQDLDLSQGEDLSMNIDTSNFSLLQQENESSDCMHETRGDVEPIMSQHANEIFSSQASLLEPHTTISFERRFTNSSSIDFSDQLQKVTEEVTSQPTMHNEHSVEIPFQEYEISNSQQVEVSSQNVKKQEKRNKKHARGMIKKHIELHKQMFNIFNCSQVETECVIRVNEGRGRRRSQVNYAEPNLRRFIFIQIKGHLLLIPN